MKNDFQQEMICEKINQDIGKNEKNDTNGIKIENNFPPFFQYVDKKKKKAIIAFKYTFGIFSNKNKKKAEEYCLKACSEGSRLALGMKHLLGFQTEVDHKKAFQILNQIKEENGDNKKKDLIEEKEQSYSLFLLGRCYNNGHGFFLLFFFF